MKRLMIVVTLLATVAGCTKMVEVPDGHCETQIISESDGNVRTECRWVPSSAMMKIPSTALPEYWDSRECNEKCTE